MTFINMHHALTNGLAMIESLFRTNENGVLREKLAEKNEHLFLLLEELSDEHHRRVRCQAELRQAKAQLEQARKTPVCVMCQNAEVQWGFDCAGGVHAVSCSDCRAKVDRCPMCRTSSPFGATVRIFFA